MRLPTLTDAQAKALAAEWHGGMYTAMYALCSSGATVLYGDEMHEDEPLARLRGELAICVEIATGQHEFEGERNVELERLYRLTNYIENAGPRCMEPEWHVSIGWDTTPPRNNVWIKGAKLRDVIRELISGNDGISDPYGGTGNVLFSITQALAVSGRTWSWDVHLGGTAPVCDLTAEGEEDARSLVDGVCAGLWTLDDLDHWGKTLDRYMDLLARAGKDYT